MCDQQLQKPLILSENYMAEDLSQLEKASGIVYVEKNDQSHTQQQQLNLFVPSTSALSGQQRSHSVSLSQLKQINQSRQ